MEALFKAQSVNILKLSKLSKFYFVICAFLIFILFCGCNTNQKSGNKENRSFKYATQNKNSADALIAQRSIDSLRFTYSFDFPVGKPDAKGYYNAQPFGENDHLGDDWNGVGGGNSDLGDPIYAVGKGYVKFSEDISGGWGKVIRIVHYLPNGTVYESVYAHCDSIMVSSDTWIEKGVQIGTIGTANGQYYAHLHLEIRNDVTMGIGGGYSTNISGYENPTVFIESHRDLSH